MVEEIKKSLKKSIRTDFIFILILTFWSVGILWVSSSNITLINNLKSYDTIYNQLSYHSISDNFIGESEKKFNEDGNKYAKLLSFSGKLKSDNSINYYVAYENPLEILNYNIEDKFLVGYEDNDISSSRVTFSSEFQSPLTVNLTKGVWCDAECIKHFNISTFEGNLFSSQDFLFNESEKNIQPVLAGYEYMEYYSIGDEIPCDSFFIENGYLKIIGFLNENSTIISNQGVKTNLNRYIVLPFQTITDLDLSINNGKFEIFSYMQCHGVAATKMSKNDFQSYINSICDELNIVPSFYVKGATNQRSYKTNLTSAELLQLIMPIFICIYILLFVIMAFYVNSKVNSCIKQYSILYAFKYSLTHIGTIILTENIIILIATLVASAGIITIISFITNVKISISSYLVLLLSYVALLLMTFIVFNFSIKKYDLSETLRKL